MKAFLTSAAAAAVLATSGIGAAPAAANFGSDNCNTGAFSGVCLGNNNQHAARYRNVDSFYGIGIATQWALTNVYNPTDLTAYRDDADAFPDVNGYDDNYSDTGTVGWAVCNQNNTGVGGERPIQVVPRSVG